MKSKSERFDCFRAFGNPDKTRSRSFLNGLSIGVQTRDITRENVGFAFLCLIDLFSLYVLFSHFGPRDATPKNSFLQVSSYERANVRITCETTKGKFP